MNPTYFTLRALSEEWRDLVGCTLEEAFSQQRDELTLVFERADGHVWRVQVGVRPVYLFRSEGYNRARRNTATLFESAAGRHVTAVRVAERDRVVFIDLDGGWGLHLFLFGAKANAFLVDTSDTIQEAFQGSPQHEGEPVPVPRPAPFVDTVEAFAARWPAEGTLARRVARARPLFDVTLAAEAVFRAGLDPDATAEPPDLGALFDTTQAVEAAFALPEPRIYTREGTASVLALSPLHHLETAAWTAEAFTSVDAAVGVFTRARLREGRFRRRYDGLRQRLDRAADRAERRLEAMLDQLARPSRADGYERDAHVLMAHAHAIPAGQEMVALPDLFEDGATRTIALDAALSGVENAQRLYERARQARQARTHAEARLVDAEAHLHETCRLRDTLAAIRTLADLDAFLEQERDALATAHADDEAERLPFRRYDVGSGYEAWVGKTAQQNDTLTLRHARPFDLWLHARGVPGSHVVLRLPGRHSQPPTEVVDRAAALAAYHSKARGSSLVPVIVVPRKWVRKPRGAAPGSVTVMREEVRLVAPSQGRS